MTQALYHIAKSQLWQSGRGPDGAVHLYLDGPFQHGRLKRPNGGAVCGKRAWEARIPDHETVSDRCKRCVEMAQRHGIKWPAMWAAGTGRPTCPRGLRPHSPTGPRCDCHKADGECQFSLLPSDVQQSLRRLQGVLGDEMRKKTVLPNVGEPVDVTAHLRVQTWTAGVDVVSATVTRLPTGSGEMPLARLDLFIRIIDPIQTVTASVKV